MPTAMVVAAVLSCVVVAGAAEGLRRHERTGRPLGSEEFVTDVEGCLGRELRPKRPGRKRKGK